MKISVIVPIYNVEKQLQRCLESILKQEESNLEIILVNDGSPDNSGEIAKEYASRYPDKVLYFEKENGGLSDARNFGIDIAQGKFITFIDSDDYIDSTMVEKMLGKIKHDNTDMCVCAFETFKDGEDPKRSYKKQAEIITADEALFRLTQREYNVYFVIACCKLIKRDVISNLRFVKGKIHEDEFMCHHLIGNCETISCIYEPLYFYYTRQGSTTHSRIIEERLSIIEAMKDRLLFTKNNFSHLTVSMQGLVLKTYTTLYCKLRQQKASKVFLNIVLEAFNDLYKQSRIRSLRFFMFKYFRSLYYLFYLIINR